MQDTVGKLTLSLQQTRQALEDARSEASRAVLDRNRSSVDAGRERTEAKEQVVHCNDVVAAS